MRKDKPSSDSTCSFIRSHLITLAEKDFSGEAFSHVQDHLDSCPDCASLVRQFSKAWGDPAPPADAQPSPSFYPRIIARIEAEEKSPPGKRGRLAVAWRILRPVAVAAIFLGGIFAGHELGKGDKTIPLPEAAFAGQMLESFESIPPGSVADFYVNRQDSAKEDLR